MNSTFHSMRRNTGLTLIEIMVALVISTFLIGGVIQVYLGNKASYRFSDASSRVQENGRFALDALTADLRLAGFFGCVDIKQNPTLVQNHLNISATFPASIYGFTTESPITLSADANGTDRLVIKGSKPGQATLTSNLLRPGNGPVVVAGNMTFSSGDIVLLTNCWTSDIFEVSGVSVTGNTSTLTHTTTTPASSPGNTNVNTCATGHCLHGSVNPALESDYTANNSTIYKLQNVIYSIQDSASGSGEPALWRSENNVNEELIEGVEDMVVMYGVDTTNDGLPNQYLPSDSALTPSQTVTSIRVWLVVRSENNNVLDSPQTYVVNGQSITSQDRRLRQVFSTTVDLRNR
jgi:type IV pilus assembly protein PilW